MRRKKPIDPRSCECCRVNLADDPHHPWPKSQGGKDKGTINACRDCHSRYHAIVGQRLAKRALARAKNHQKWYSTWDVGVDLMGKKGGVNPHIMAPEWVVQEWADYLSMGEVDGRNDKKLSQLGTIMPSPWLKGEF